MTVEDADKFDRNYGFRVEISPGPPADAVHGQWKTIRGGGLRLHESVCSTGQDSITQHTLGICEWEDLVLTGAINSDRKDMLQWYDDMVNKGDAGSVYRSVTVTRLNRDGSDMNATTWNECFLTAYSLTPLDSEEEDVECIETVEICTGYSDDYLG